ncbi:V-type ATP synthase subunit K [Pontiella sp.]|jgi:V/A-type H+-transporting ATPase subunit K|uniref:V-type ATP synthase subunit K n=1 Tax=Pontiella sp. TaxID=2837462 RepID=UPI0035649290
MDITAIEAAKMGAAMALGFGAIGSALGTGTAGMAGIGAWKKCYLQGKAAPFILLVFIGAPLSQTIYGMLLMNFILNAAEPSVAQLGAGIIGGIAMGFSAWYQGKAGAAGSDALAETGQGFGNYLTVLGIVETVALFVMIFIQKAL